MRAIFISGHLDMTAAEFEEHYASRLRALAADPDVSFIVGDAPGADVMAQECLKALGISRMTVYHMFVAPRHWCGIGTLKGGYASDKARDVAMTAESTEDLAWVRPGREKSGTAKNLLRRVTKL